MFVDCFAFLGLQTEVFDDRFLDRFDECQAVEQVGQIPETFQYIIENNLFYGITAFDGRLLKAEVSAADEQNKILTHKICMMDVYGNDLAEYVCSADDAYRVTTLTATTDDGFLFVLGFEDYEYEQGIWASNKGFASRVIKCDKNGNVQFDTAVDSVEGRALKYCFEKNGLFYLFGTRETPETKRQGVGSPSDIYMTILDQSGTVLKNQCIAGSGFDSLHAAEISGDTFILTVSSQSDDGDFAGSRSKGYLIDWVIAVNDDLEIIKMKKKAGRDWFDERIGEKNGAPVYQSDELLCNFDAGRVDAFIDYGDFYLIVSENNTGIYENTPPVISSIWYYTETVYSAYDYDGKLIFRASVDSSPDYDAKVEAMYNENSTTPAPNPGAGALSAAGFSILTLRKQNQNKAKMLLWYNTSVKHKENSFYRSVFPYEQPYLSADRRRRLPGFQHLLAAAGTGLQSPRPGSSQ